MRSSCVKLLGSCLLAIFLFLPGCQSHTVLDPQDPVVLTLWHNYGGPMKLTMDELIDEFNDTVGAEKGIILSVTSISGSATIHEKLTMAAAGDPGAPQLPDITTAYPRTAIILAENDLLADLGEHFSEAELSAYVPDFLEEGRLEQDKLYVFPTAKSTEVLFVNKTVFDRFARDTEISYGDLRTFEGIKKAAARYYEWEGEQAPGMENGSKTFFMPDSPFNLAMVGYQQLGDDFLKDEQLNLSSPKFARVWDVYYEPAVRGHLAIFDGYAADLMKTGDIICALGSTAGVLFYPSTVTYPNNITEPVEYAILPYPVFEGGDKLAVQRGGGMCVIQSSQEKEYAAAVFLKWFTEPEQNLRFIASTGYLPVTEEAFENIMALEIDNIPDPDIQSLLRTAVEMQQEYEFIIPPTFEEFDNLQRNYEEQLKLFALESKTEYLDLLNQLDTDEAYRQAAKEKDDFLARHGW